MASAITLIGFGEAAQAFVAPKWLARSFDIATRDPALADVKHADFARSGVTGCDDAAAALSGAGLVLSLVTADQALAAAQSGVLHLSESALWCDMNSVAPTTKHAAAQAIEAAGGRYVDCAVMAPVHPARRRVPLILSGPHAAEAASLPASLGFDSVRAIAGPIGAASTIKMLRSVIIKGIEALTAEAFLAASHAGVTDELLDSLGDGWTAKADYNLDRMLVHDTRRAAEMDEVAATLVALGIEPLMSRAVALRQHALGGLGGASPPGLAAKLALLDARSAA